MSKIVIFGAAEMAEVAHYYFQHDSEHDVAAFTVDKEFLRQEEFCGLPVVPFEEIEKQFPPSSNSMFIALGYSKVNKMREAKFNEAKSRGYQLISYVSSRATVWPGFQVGENCFILEDNTIQPFVEIGNNVTLWSGNHIGHHSKIGDNVFISSHVVISGGVAIEPNCFIGVNSTIRDHLTIARECVIGMGCVISKDTKEREVYVGEASSASRVPSNRLKNI